MKKILLGLIVVMLCLTGCKTQNLDMSVNDIVNKLNEGIEKDLPKLGEVEITKENMSYYIGVDNLDIKDAVASEPLMGSIAHSVVVIKVNDSVDVQKAKKEIKEKVDPRKWICVEAEKVVVLDKGDVIVLIMSTEDIASKVEENFKKLK